MDRKFALEAKYKIAEKGSNSPSKGIAPAEGVKPHVLVGIPHTGQIRAELGVNFVQWMSDPRFTTEILPVKKLRPVTHARNFLVKEFLDNPAFGECQYILMVDSDMSTPPNILELALYNKPIMGALTFMVKEGHVVPIAMRRHGRGYSLVTPLPGNDLVEVDATGTGCLMIRRDVFSRLKRPFFEYVLDDNGLVQLGNDFYFCMKAKEAGIPVFIHTGYVTAHDQTVDITDMYFAQLKGGIERAGKN